MSSDPKVVAILAANAAFSSILHMVLSEHRELRVRVFESEEMLSLYMHIAPVDLLVCDHDDADESVTSVVPRLRAKAALVRPEFQVIALTRKVSPTLKASCVAAGIDEVILKPMSPKYLEDRVLSRLREGPRHIVTNAYAGPDRRNRLTPRSAPSERFDRRDSNVVPLFGARTSFGEPLR
ncbi:hypothetical protein [Mariluticola halotolerans]|uniref:hypothetical protein n=1 Tax=Mariluticola halotolerans TaxID=2909283 RepID=UPI0026E26E26|nr:hypothetical protein [Mariluticola halotolerans]UJQ95769.1 hypothetical protein L1P08_07230 [Mariluticola halotolerans]